MQRNNNNDKNKNENKKVAYSSCWSASPIPWTIEVFAAVHPAVTRRTSMPIRATRPYHHHPSCRHSPYIRAHPSHPPSSSSPILAPPVIHLCSSQPPALIITTHPSTSGRTSVPITATRRHPSPILAPPVVHPCSFQPPAVTHRPSLHHPPCDIISQQRRRGC